MGIDFGLCLYDEDALVDVGDGVLDKVKNVKVTKGGNNQNKGKKVVDEQPPAPEKISDLQKESIQKLCDMLKVAMPEKVDTLAFLEARELIVKLKEKYKEMKTQQVDQSVQSNGHQVEPEPAQQPPSKQQLTSIDKLCDRLQRPVPAVQSFNEARELIRQLTAEYRDQKQTELAAKDEPEAQGLTVKEIYEHCSQLGLIKTKTDFYQYASEALGFAVTAENVMSLNQENLSMIVATSAVQQAS